MKNSMNIVGLIVVSAVLYSSLSKADCPQPAPAGKCGRSNSGQSCDNGCVSTTGTQIDIKNCTGSSGNTECLYNTINWSATYNYYNQNYATDGKTCLGCAASTIVYLPDDPNHPPTVWGTCQDAYSGTKNCGG